MEFIPFIGKLRAVDLPIRKRRVTAKLTVGARFPGKQQKVEAF